MPPVAAGLPIKPKGARTPRGARPRNAAALPAAVRPGLEAVREWLTARGWAAFAFQEEAWSAFARGESGLINVPTGAGKTYAAYLGPLAELVDETAAKGAAPQGLRVLLITPLRAVSRDTEAALRDPVVWLTERGLLPRAGCKPAVRVESRTGDTSASVRQRQREQLPQVLITTPESLSLMLAQAAAGSRLAGLRAVIVDEWHELMSSKRGTQTELALARLRRMAPGLRVWGLSATLANLDEAARAVVGVPLADSALATSRPSRSVSRSAPTIIRARIDRPISIQTVIPADPSTLPWAGHMGLRMLPDLLGHLDPACPTLIFTNTRAQAEIWYQAILYTRPEWAGVLGLHHGSIDRKERERVEAGLKAGTTRLVVCTSSLDLGVDFAPVERVVQIGSPKGVARLLQRAGRSGHRPGASSRILCVPTHGLELIEIAAVRRAISAGEIEPRPSPSKPLDVLAQHLVTCAMGGGFDADELFEEIRTAWSYRDLTREEFDWALALVREGGGTLRAYPQYNKVVLESGRYVVKNPRIAQLHKMNIGTITGEATVQLVFTSGRRIGTIEEGFISRLRPGERFFFGGRTLEFVRMGDVEAFVRPARGRSNYTPRWSGTKLPISELLSDEVRRTLGREAQQNSGTEASPQDEEPELLAAGRLLAVQERVSAIPAENQCLVEIVNTRQGSHLFVFPFEGGLVHGGIAALIALRLSRLIPATFTLAANDYGFEVLAAGSFDFEKVLSPAVFTLENLASDVIESVNLGALAKRQFREIARVAGLVFQTYPGARKSGRQVQASSSLLFDVFTEFDPGNLLMEQARREVLDRHFERSRLARTLERLQQSELLIRRPAGPTPLSFPLILERESGKLSSQSLADRVDRMKLAWEGVPAAPIRRSGRGARR